MKKLRNNFALALGMLAVAGLPLMADDSGTSAPSATGKTNAMARIEAAMTKQVDVLTGLLDKVPQQAQAGIEKARDAVTAAFQKSVTTLQGLIGKVPDKASTRIEAALARVEQSRDAA